MFPSNPLLIGVPFFLLFNLNKEQPKKTAKKDTSGVPSSSIRCAGHFPGKNPGALGRSNHDDWDFSIRGLKGGMKVGGVKEIRPNLVESRVGFRV